MKHFKLKIIVTKYGLRGMSGLMMVCEVLQLYQIITIMCKVQCSLIYWKKLT